MPPLDGSGWTMEWLTVGWLKEHWVEVASLGVAVASASASVVSGVLALFAGNPVETATLAVAAGALGFVVGWGLPAARRAREVRSIRRAYRLMPEETRRLIMQAAKDGGILVMVNSDEYVATRAAVGAGMLCSTDDRDYSQYLRTPVVVMEALQGVDDSV